MRWWPRGPVGAGEPGVTSPPRTAPAAVGWHRHAPWRAESVCNPHAHRLQAPPNHI